MSKLKHSLAAPAGLSLLIGLIALATPRTTRGQGGGNQQPLNVNVVNTPLPVTGTVSEGNLGDSPLPVRDVDNPARSAVQAVNGCVTAESTIRCENEVYTVPEGKRLVIEYASTRAN